MPSLRVKTKSFQCLGPCSTCVTRVENWSVHIFHVRWVCTPCNSNFWLKPGWSSSPFLGFLVGLTYIWRSVRLSLHMHPCVSKNLTPRRMLKKCFCKSLPFFYFLTFEKGRLPYIHPVGWLVGRSVGRSTSPLIFSIYRGIKALYQPSTTNSITN